MIYGVMYDQARFIWHDLDDWVQSALDLGNALTNADTILQGIENREMQLYVVQENEKLVAVFVTEIIEEDQAKVCNTIVLAGEGMDRWLGDVEHTICEFAKSQNCNYVKMKGRRGWLKKLNQYGWSESSVEMHKEL